MESIEARRILLENRELAQVLLSSFSPDEESAQKAHAILLRSGISEEHCAQRYMELLEAIQKLINYWSETHYPNLNDGYSMFQPYFGFDAA